MSNEEEKKGTEEDERFPAQLKSDILKITLEDLKWLNLEEKYKIIRKLSEGAFGQVFKLMRLSDSKNFAAKCIPIKSIYDNSELMKTYVEREISLLMSLNHNYIMELEGECFITGRAQFWLEDQLVIISELAEGNLEEYIKKYQGHIPEEKIMRLFT